MKEESKVYLRLGTEENGVANRSVLSFTDQRISSTNSRGSYRKTELELTKVIVEKGMCK